MPWWRPRPARSWPARTFRHGAWTEDDSVFEEILPDVTEALSAALETGKADAYSLQQVMRRTFGDGWIGRRLKRRPMIVPVVIEA